MLLFVIYRAVDAAIKNGGGTLERLKPALVKKQY
jgi:hypothetical protein